MESKIGEKLFLVPHSCGWLVSKSQKDATETVSALISNNEFEASIPVLEVRITNTMKMVPTLVDEDPYCDHPECPGGIGPHRRSECPCDLQDKIRAVMTGEAGDSILPESVEIDPRD